ncbi:cation:proton antiporter [Streptomyces syringium]|uniref:cation:proton antiporter n=1 Tax=Streptomyces syringium TaxID=76729 RepID=UPI0033C49F70
MAAFVMQAAHVVAALVVVLLLACVGRSIARLLRQPEVVGEITAGLLSGPAALALLGDEGFGAVLPQPVFEDLKLVGQAGLILFLVGLAHDMRSGPSRPPRRATLWVSAGALVPPLLCGALLAAWVIAGDDGALRGNAPQSAFVLMTAVSMSISAVPVMARIITSRRMENTAAGSVTLASAIVTDAAGWLLLTVALCLNADSAGGFTGSLQALALGAACSLAIRYGLRSPVARPLCARAPYGMAGVLGAAAIAVSVAMEHLGMTAILGAALVGLSIPAEKSAPWDEAVAAVSRIGRALVPAFFVVTGISVLNRSFAVVPWALIALSIALAVLGKIVGGYVGARIAGQPRHVAREVGVLMNTRGLTELILLQAGYAAGILTAPMVLALVVMALVTTAMTGPALSILKRGEARPRPLPVLKAAGSSG